MERLIQNSHRNEALDDRVQEGKYDLVGPNNLVILPEVWEESIQPQ